MLPKEKHPNPELKEKAEQAMRELDLTQSLISDEIEKKEKTGKRFCLPKRPVILFIEDEAFRKQIASYFVENEFDVTEVENPGAVQDMLMKIGESSPLVLDFRSFQEYEPTMNGHTRSCVLFSKEEAENTENLLRVKNKSLFFFASPLDVRALVTLVKCAL